MSFDPAALEAFIFNSPVRAGRYLFGMFGADAVLVTNVLDLARYLSMLLRKGEGVLTLDSFDALVRPRVKLPSQPRVMPWGCRSRTIFSASSSSGTRGA